MNDSVVIGSSEYKDLIRLKAREHRVAYKDLAATVKEFLE